MFPSSFSVVINTLNRADHLERALRGLLSQRFEPFEIIVVAGPCTDHTPEVLREFRDQVKEVSCPVANLSVSRNLGIGAAAGEAVAFLDDDAIPTFDWLQCLARGFAAPAVAAVGGYVRDNTGVTFQSRTIVCNRFGDVVPSAKEGTSPAVQPGAFLYPAPMGCNVAFLRLELLEMGGFDEEFAYYLDETDVLLRLADRGKEARFVPEAEVHHQFAPSHIRTERRIPRTLYEPVKNKVYFALRNGLAWHPLSDIMDNLRAFYVAQKKSLVYWLHHGAIDVETHFRLSHEVEAGVRDGVTRGLGPDLRRIRAPLPQDPRFRHLKRVTPKKSAGERLRLGFVAHDRLSRGPGGAPTGEAFELAAQFAGKGHEVSFLTRAEGHETVDFVDGIWLHGLNPSPAGSASSARPRRAATEGYLRKVTGALRTIEDRYGLDVICGAEDRVRHLAALCDAGGISGCEIVPLPVLRARFAETAGENVTVRSRREKDAAA